MPIEGESAISIKVDQCPREEIVGSAEETGNSSEIVVLQGNVSSQ